MATSYSKRLDSARKEIRLLHLQPGGKEDFLVCNVMTVSLRDAPAYEALSYVWGDVSDTGPISVDGRDFTVTRHLALALYHVRSPCKARTLWADAICINQEDVQERNEQVSLMDLIYASASDVLIFLGPADEGSDDGFDTLRRIGEGKPTDRESALQAYKHCHEWLHRRAWFYRLWVLQEMALAQNMPIVWCGQKSIAWEVLISGWTKLWETAQPSTSFSFNIVRGYIAKMENSLLLSQPVSWFADIDFGFSVERLKFLNDLRKTVSENGGMSLMELLPISRDCAATNPRDKIYGLLSLLRKEDRKFLTVDYHKPVAEVYGEAMAEVFRRGKGPYLLSTMALPDPSSGLAFPSWVPDFSTRPDEGAEGVKPLPLHTPGIGASGQEAHSPNGIVASDLQTLHIRGLFVDIIDEVLHLRDYVDDCIEQLPEVDELVRRAYAKDPENRSRPYINRFKHKEPLWRMLISNKDSDSKVAPASYETMYEVVRKLRPVPPEFAGGGEDIDEYSTTRKWESEYRDQLFGQVPNRSFFTTETGLIGRGMPWVQKGDLVVVWFGAPVPFVLRPCEDFYKVVGVAYVAGIMEGEMVNEVYHKGLQQLKEFVIR